MLSTMLERKVGNCHIQGPQPIKRNELVSKCRDQLKYTLARYDTTD